MRLVYLFSGCLILGMIISQIFDLESALPYTTFFADICLAFIMMEVGMEFVLHRSQWKKYLKDYVVAALAAALPWIFCFLYFFFVFKTGRSWEEILLVSRFAAPTSSGILFTLLLAAGLGMTWVFRKIEILAILDDIDTILLLIPLQFLLTGGRLGLISVIFFIAILLFLTWRFPHTLKIPSGRVWLLGYSVLMVIILRSLRIGIDVEFEILLPAFVLGSILYNPHDPRREDEHVHEHAYAEAEERPLALVERGIKAIFMVLVGLSLPKTNILDGQIGVTLFHVVLVTLLANLGKCFPLFCYKDEASFRKRAAVCIGMFPRGEVGAGILVLAIEHGVSGYITTVAGLSLALNLLLTGLFIWFVIKLTQDKAAAV